MTERLMQVVEVRIESVADVTGSHDDDDVAAAAAGEVKMETEDDDDDDDSEEQPLLVVFSNDRHHRRFDSRELHEMIEREMDLYKDLPAAALPTHPADYSDYNSLAVGQSVGGVA